MGCLSLTEINERLAQYLKAEACILKNQSYTVGDRTYTRANLKWVQQQIKELQTQKCAASGHGSIRVRRLIYRDN